MVAWLVLGWSAGIDCTCRSAASAAAGRGGGRAGCSTAPHLVPETGKFRELGTGTAAEEIIRQDKSKMQEIELCYL